ncbi:pregnancy-associated glycoprotein 2 precursor [Cordyceps fumosorosea ARSEF 2679]|uniref:Pregnancy-associated glycoprotein 2 n=1 Tax=Cordyceps fumosorosea (strain ARSEF 2679) TaxID=1081104 RepID=A0A167XCZ8_CORFA|nr:pregnancy-associated glycoprotein 2 precursor [Cordyceps fumosorosea ARSEF 2679]OAA64824.1 pregnancy-associated glycoprotein 2 precursor [Cordyceps fumosorosea ARSEF 2679]
MKVPASVAVVSLLSLVDHVQSAITLPLKPLDKKIGAMIKQSTKPKAGDGTTITVPVKDWIKHTADLQWYTEIEVGTPPQKFNVIFDTGSYDMFIANKNCSGAGNSRLFDPDQSSTFNLQPDQPQSFGYGTGVDSIPLQYSGEGSSGIIVTDKVGIAGHAVDAQQFLLCDQYPEFMADVPFDGVMGIGVEGATGLPSGKPWYWALYNSGQLAGPEFSLYYPAGKPDGAEMTLGGTNPDRYTGDIHKVKLYRTGNFVVDQPAMAINGVPLAAAAGKQTILDSGTAYFAADSDVVKAFYASVSPKIKQLNHEAWGVECDVIESLAVDITFTFGSGADTFNATMPKEAFNLGPYEGKPGICQTVFSTIDLGGSFLIGAPLLKQYYTVWDGHNLEMGFAELKK